MFKESQLQPKWRVNALKCTGVPIHMEPLLTIHRLRTRAQPQSITPPIIFRPATAPVPSSDGEYRGVPPFIPPESMFTLELTSILRSQRTEFEDVPPSRRPQRWSVGRHGDTADGVFIPARQPTQPAPLHGVPPRIPSAPPSLGYAPEGEIPSLVPSGMHMRARSVYYRRPSHP